MTQDVSKTTFPALTGFRFVSALLVFIFHYNPFRQGSFIWGLCNEMYIGVGMFFVLSGFLITYNYYEKARPDWAFFKIFFVRRFARIYPIYFLLILLYFIYHFFKQPLSNFFTQFFLSVFLLKGFSEKYLLTGIAQAWSLTTEECFYFFAPFIYWLIKFKKIFWLQVFFLVLIGIALVSISQTIPEFHFFESYHVLFIATFFGRCFEFYIGIQLALAIKGRKSWKPTTCGRNTMLGSILVIGCLIAMNSIRFLYQVNYASSSPPGLIVNNIILAFSVSILLNGLIKERTFFSKVLSCPFIVLLGKASYAFYLIHAGFIADFLTKYTGSNIILKFILLQMIAVLLYYLIERPLNWKIRTNILQS